MNSSNIQQKLENLTLLASVTPINSYCLAYIFAVIISRIADILVASSVCPISRAGVGKLFHEGYMPYWLQQLQIYHIYYKS